ncbi:endo alpha-1,4 polygalactosaminidase [Ectobacillus sp. JY-23]|uniref:endo alpha-1,4 polygalactosaminidase n=1 Tax=Ectobacillus sp. JY-23 TaxID=2933872 RepID=UPI001FF6660B|nr:endo alpha-1,4 polygalactosaminidase [Ectobacillus sp. JY-23]UOY92221.1 endo alpha-1,4 polygalactosaminidase [Ectobacillus sp. JY-23]
MKVVKFLFCVVVALAAFWPSIGKVQASLVNPLKGAKTYKIFYNAPNKRMLSQLATYDFVIIEPYHYNATKIQQLQAKGTKVYGYISTMEAASWNQELMKRFAAKDFFYRGGKKVHYAEWDSYLMDITSVHYRGILMEEIKKHIVEKGFDGIFLDTVGDIDNEHTGSVLLQQRQGMKTFLQGIQKKYPNLSLIQNWGFATLKSTTAPYVDAIMWEGFHYKSVARDEWSLNRIRDLHALRKQYEIEVLTVSSAEKEKSTLLAKQNGFIHFHTNRGYDAW